MTTWLERAEDEIKRFANRYKSAYAKRQRIVSASFEIGCFLAVVSFYERVGAVTLENLLPSGEFRYLTSPSGNPHNFSFVRVRIKDTSYEIRQQVRVRSHVDPDIAFTPDLLVVRANAEFEASHDSDYASGRRRFFAVSSKDVIAAHECKSLPPFPELLVSFIGTFVTAHDWVDTDPPRYRRSPRGPHLAPSLFVGGTARALHERMVSALERSYPMNIILGVHSAGWARLRSRTRLYIEA